MAPFTAEPFVAYADLITRDFPFLDYGFARSLTPSDRLHAARDPSKRISTSPLEISPLSRINNLNAGCKQAKRIYNLRSCLDADC